jgi:NAD(P)-dependent dehydrogenase (short-subunit alcohol dehydrogenase family)
MKIVVITGSARGIGYGLADSFLSRGSGVVICDLNQEKVEDAVAKLDRKHGSGRIFGVLCDVTEIEQVKYLWGSSVDHFGSVDIWINNAGVSTARKKYWEYSTNELKSVVDVNLLGALYGSQVALQGMLEQGSGSLYNVEGLGSNGQIVEGLSLYGTTKYGVAYLNRSLVKEVESTPVIVGVISPGMVLTDLLIGEREADSAEWEETKRIFNILADKVETVTPWLADRVLENTRNGARIEWLTRSKVAWRFISAPLRKRDLFE